MGADMGPLAFSTMDLGAAKLRAAYTEGAVRPDPRCLLIGWQSDEGMPLHLFYDFAHPGRDDARVVKRHLMGGPFHNQFETLREMLGWGALARFRVETSAQRCVGLFGDTDDNDVVAHLAPIMKTLGFRTPVATGRYCGLYESPDACLVTSAVPGDPPRFHVFRIGGVDPGRVRRILGEITNSTSLEVEVKSWSPPSEPGASPSK